MIAETVGWGWAYIQHIVLMFYWMWLPAVFGAAILSARYRLSLREIALKRQTETAGLLAAVGWGMTSGVGRRHALATVEQLWARGVSPPVVLAYLVSSHNLGLYLLLLFTVLIGLEFGLGLFLGGLVMIGLIRLFAPLLAPERGDRGNSKVEERSSIEAGVLLLSWHALLGSRRGWGAILREAARPLRHLSGSLLGGLLLAALVLAMDNHGYWFFPKWLGDEGLGPALAGAFLAPFLSVVLFLSPGGNFFVASSIWKTWTLAYPGVLSFVLMSLLNPLTVHGLLRHSDRRRGLLLVLALYLAAALSGLVVTGLLTLLGLEVTHVPWFRDLVDRIIMELPFTMLGAPGGGMKGM
jgi:uncharacterized membrane protein YraQ (UPF0718 family)